MSVVKLKEEIDKKQKNLFISSHLHQLLPCYINFSLEFPVLANRVIETHQLVCINMQHLAAVDLLFPIVFLTGNQILDLLEILLILCVALLVLVFED